MSALDDVVGIVVASLVIAICLAGIGIRILENSPNFPTAVAVWMVTIAGAVGAAYGIAALASHAGLLR
jgi:TRAP-type C4-dicarboxylate transport system permease small subunit